MSSTGRTSPTKPAPYHGDLEIGQTTHKHKRQNSRTPFAQRRDMRERERRDEAVNTVMKKLEANLVCVAA